MGDYNLTIAGLLKEGTLTLKEKGFDDARSEAEVLLASVLGIPRWKLFTGHKNTVPDSRARQFQEQITGRSEQCPAAYLTGHKEFYGLEFIVKPAVLIPRPETELLVDTALNYLKKRLQKEPGRSHFNIIDIGTGSGAVAVSLACHYPAVVRIWAVDISAAALETARQNATRHGVTEQISFLQGNYWNPLAGSGLKFDVVVSNPPYIPRNLLPCLPETVRRYEPRLALDGGEDGLDAYREIAGSLPRFLAPASLTALETDKELHHHVAGILQTALPESTPETCKDLQGYPRVVTVEK